MNTQATLARMNELQLELNAIEALMEPNLIPAIQEALDSEWEHVMSELELLGQLLDLDIEDTRGCATCSGCAYCEDTGSYDPDGEI
jgi:hypothetical protein